MDSDSSRGRQLAFHVVLACAAAMLGCSDSKTTGTQASPITAPNGSAGGGGAGGTVTTGNAGASAPAPDAGSMPAKPSGSTTAGCGATDFPASGTQMLDVSGMQREFIVKIPSNYNASTPYKLIFAWHWLGGMATQVASLGYYGLESRAAGTVIFVSAQGLQTSNSVGSGPGWDNMGGRDVAFTRAMLAWLRTSYCIDNDRIFSVGMSYGGIMSNTVGCALGDEFRAIAPMSGLGPFGQCVGQVAVWQSHGNMDTIVPFSSGQQSRDHWVTANHCQNSALPIGSNGCVAYEGCDRGFPVQWCEFSGGHTIPPFASEAIWTFFSQF